MRHPDGPVVHAERLGTDLGNNRLDALSDRRGPSHDFDAAIRINLDAVVVVGTEPALFDVAAETGADQLAVFAPFGQISRELVEIDMGKQSIEETSS